MIKLFLVLSSLILRNRLVASNCLGLHDTCQYDSECCGHPANQAIRCEARNQGLEKRCEEGRKQLQPCESNGQCLSQTCVGGLCIPHGRARTPVDFHTITVEENSVESENGASAPCVCDRVEEQNALLAIDNDLSTDYTNYHSIFPALTVSPSLQSPLRVMEVCSSSQDSANDPLCFRIGGYSEATQTYAIVQHGEIPLTDARQDCKNVTIHGRINYPAYKVEFGCRRGGYSSSCNIDEISAVACTPGKALCLEVNPKGRDENCNIDHEQDGTDAFSAFHSHSVDYKINSDQTVFTYSFMNKLTGSRFFPDLSHAVLQYEGACCVAATRVYGLQNGEEFNYHMSDSEGFHVEDPNPDVCMAGIDLPGVVGLKTFYYEITVNGKFTTTAEVDYVLKGGIYAKYGKVQGPDCRCAATGSGRRGLSLQSRKAEQCVDKPVSISQLKLYGKTNE